MADHPYVGIGLGVLVAGLVHTGKVVARPAINAGTLGAGAPVVSAAEDTASVGLSLIAIFIPVLVVVALLLLGVGLYLLSRKVRRWRRSRGNGVRGAAT
jgi:hypothetical protein